MTSSRLMTVLRGTALSPPPVWLMRQAGRYLPEYREIRAQVGGFLELCYRPDLAAEVTLQPVRRFDVDAAIVFADILLVPHALGLRVDFEEGQGPCIEPVTDAASVARLDTAGAVGRLSPVAETVTRVRRELAPDKALIGFCGGPWTVATYMAAGGASADQLAARLWAYRDPDSFQSLVDILVEISADYLVAQARAGADALKIFDSWAGVLPPDQFERWVVAPTQVIVQKVRATAPDVPIIGFARGAGLRAARLAEAAELDALALDQTADVTVLRATTRPGLALQGNIDPVALLAGGEALDAAVDATLAAFAGGPHVCNLGHGVHKDTPPEHVARLIARVRASGDGKRTVG